MVDRGQWGRREPWQLSMVVGILIIIKLEAFLRHEYDYFQEFFIFEGNLI